MARGLDKGQEVSSKSLFRDIRTPYQKYSDWLETPEGMMMNFGGAIGFMIAIPQYFEIGILYGLYLYWMIKSKRFMLPFRLPLSSELMDYNDIKPGTEAEPLKASGIAFFGNEIRTKKELWFTNGDMRTHVLIFGSTGAGKTEMLLSIAFNSLVQGSGFIYVDGKGENALYTKVFAMARAMGREDDVLVINYMTGSRDVFGPQSSKLSNTLNPFVSGSSGGLTELLVSLMDDSGGDNAMWKGRAISLISAIMMALVWMRDRKEILLDVDVIRNYMILDNIIDLSKRKDLPTHVKQAIEAYLVSLPGYQASAGKKQSETVFDQHGYLQMQFTKILGSLSDSYGYIFRTNLGEVDFWDVVVNRRILVVLLPALEKSSEELANLGKIIVACLKQMMATGLGAQIEGDYADIIETKPTASPTPFVCILDEYGYYAVKGAAVMPAQGRSLGFSMIFAGQDYPAFEKASKEEAASTVANCNIKIFGKLEDPKDTLELFIKSVGQAYTATSAGSNMNTNALFSRALDNQNISFDKRDRGDLLDLKEQGMGQVHIIFKSFVIRGNMFFANPKVPKKIRVNYFLKVEPPTREELLKNEEILTTFMNNLLDLERLAEYADTFKEDSVEEIVRIKGVFDAEEFKGKNNNILKSILGIMTQWHLHSAAMSDFQSSLTDFNDFDDNDEEDKFNVFDGFEEDDDEDGDDYPPFLNKEQTLENIKNTEQLVDSMSSREAEINAKQMIEDMKMVSSYPNVSEVPEEIDTDELLDLLSEMSDSIDEGNY